MQITETSADGLKREFKVVISASDIEQKTEGRLRELSSSLRIPGFRPGKVPLNIVKQRYGQSVMGEVLEQAVADSSRQAMMERGLRPALQPKIEVQQFDTGKDLEYTMALELLPDVEPADLTAIEIERPVAEVTDQQVQEALDRIAESRRDYETADKAAEKDDAVVIDFDGSVDGEARPGMKGEGHQLILGSGSFIDTFEDQLVGAKAGDHRTVKVTFPEGYHAAELSGKEAVFEVDVKEVKVAKPVAVDDEFAKGLGIEDLGKLKEMIRERISQDYAQMSRARAKRTLLDILAERHDFAVPQGMVDIEFDAIWRRLKDELDRGNAGEDQGKPEDELKAEYRAIAERRVRLGLLLSEIGRRNDVQVSQDELNRAVMAEAQRYPGQERQVFEFFRNNPQAIDSLRAPLFEDKVVDYILGQAKVTDRTVSVEELARDPEDSAQAA
ncbi:trigger factor [Arenibaculum pallidiluteum]|uniref:trigger factor n=1 Tax=Arenibaculum pallidiluteum TaxID=2812559 RepID=UPI001A97C472|nr:trigger factor [Arenibaculum pallidiluteum]